MSEVQNEVNDIVAEVNGLIREIGEGKLKTDDVARIVADYAGLVNCYPGTPTDICCEKAYFISLSVSRPGSSKPHLKFGEALEQIVLHMTRKCGSITHMAILLTDNWDAQAFEKYFPSIKSFKHLYLEAYLVVGDKVSRIEI